MWAWIRKLLGTEPVEPVAPDVFTMGEVVLLIESPATEQRVGDVSSLSTYIEALVARCGAHLADTPLVTGLDLTIALWPGGRSRAWLRCTEPVSVHGLVDALETVPALAVLGPIAFIIRGGVRGPGNPAPPLMPQAWIDHLAHVGKKTMTVDELLVDLQPQ